jgi:hypothetical protein
MILVLRINRRIESSVAKAKTLLSKRLVQPGKVSPTKMRHTLKGVPHRAVSVFVYFSLP